MTKQDILELFADQAKNFEGLLIKEREEREKSRIEFEKNLEQERKERALSRLEFDKKIVELSGTWGKFVAEMVKPRIVEIANDDKFQPKIWKTDYWTFLCCANTDTNGPGIGVS